MIGKYGKMETKDSEPVDVFQARMLQAIANELREGNRLKALEILQTQQHHLEVLKTNGGNITMDGIDEFKKALDDQA